VLLAAVYPLGACGTTEVVPFPSPSPDGGVFHREFV